MKTLFTCLLISCSVIFSVSRKYKTIEESIKEYFDHQNVKSFYEHWKKYRAPIEQSITQTLKETYGEYGLNIYIQGRGKSLQLSDGLFVSDNMVHVLFKDLYLTEFPHLRAPEVSLALASNVLRVGTAVSKMFIETNYLLFRNLSDVVYSSTPFDPYKASPFSLPQVKNVGKATIIAEGCYLTGYTVASLSGPTVSLGHDTFRLINCKFSVEISSPGTGSPPVIAPYLSREQGKELELLLSRPIRDELIPKLQGITFTYVNASSLLGPQLPWLREHQHKLFKLTSAFMSEVVTNLNKQTIAKDGGVDTLEDQTFSWKDKYNGNIQDTTVTIANVTISGMDTAYSAQNGGPFKMPKTTIDDTIRFSSLQVRGSLFLKEGVKINPYIFYGEIKDVTFFTSIAIQMQEDKDEPTRKVNGCTFTGWRFMDLHTPIIPLIAPNALVTGYLLNKLPMFMVQHMSSFLSEAVLKADHMQEEYEEQGAGGDQVNNENQSAQNGNKADSNIGNGQSNEHNKNGGGTDTNMDSDRMFVKPMFADVNNREVSVNGNQGNEESDNDNKTAGNMENVESAGQNLNGQSNERNENVEADKHNSQDGTDRENLNSGTNTNMDSDRMFNKPMLADVNNEGSSVDGNQGNDENNNKNDGNGESAEQNVNGQSNEPNENGETDKQHSQGGSDRENLNGGTNTNVDSDRMFNKPMFADVNNEGASVDGNQGNDEDGNKNDGNGESAEKNANGQSNEHNENGEADEQHSQAGSDRENRDGGANTNMDSDRMFNKPMLAGVNNEGASVDGQENDENDNKNDENSEVDNQDNGASDALNRHEARSNEDDDKASGGTGNLGAENDKQDSERLLDKPMFADVNNKNVVNENKDDVENGESVGHNDNDQSDRDAVNGDADIGSGEENPSKNNDKQHSQQGSNRDDLNTNTNENMDSERLIDKPMFADINNEDVYLNGNQGNAENRDDENVKSDGNNKNGESAENDGNGQENNKDESGNEDAVDDKQKGSDKENINVDNDENMFAKPMFGDMSNGNVRRQVFRAHPGSGKKSSNKNKDKRRRNKNDHPNKLRPLPYARRAHDSDNEIHSD